MLAGDARWMTVSNSVKAQHGTTTAGDCVFFSDPDAPSHAVGELLLNVALGDEQFSIVSRWRHVGASTDARLRDYSIEDDVAILPSACLLCSCTHRQNEAGTSSFVYVPWEFRV